jgi:predicted metal-binding membrane protein
MITAGRLRERPRSLWGIPPAVLGAIALAWVIAAVAQATGRGRLVQHDALIHSGLPLWAGLGVHLVAWQAMIAAMMLPSSLPLVRLFAFVSRNQDRPAAAMGSFLGGYALVWTGFGALAFLGDVLLHRTVDATPWLTERPWLVGGSVLILAGAFQFSSLKDQCLRVCRKPSGFLIQRYGRGLGTAFRLGRDHGLFCLGCCWALMLVGFAAGVANLWWMVALTAVMAFEKTGHEGQRGVVPIGLALIAIGIVVLTHTSWLPSLLGA